jgi:PhzF family phenazine biosynthesis protein
MKSFRFKKIDTFTGGYAPGNPAGCVFLDAPGDISDAEMLEIAKQLKGFVSEVAYVFPESGGFFLRYFSSEKEVDFCGHATVAAMYDLFTFGSLKGKCEASLRVGKSRLAAWFEQGDDSVFIAAPEPRFLLMEIPEEETVRALGITLTDLNAKYKTAFVNCGLNSLLVPIRQASVLTDVLPEMEKLADFCVKYGVDTVAVYSDDHILPGSNWRTRVFSPRFGYLEDPATGSGNAAFGNWLLKEGLWNGEPLTIEQGRSYRAPNIVRLKTAMIDGKKRLLFGGSATVRINGHYILY